MKLTPSTLVPPAGTSSGLRRPFDRFAMRSSFAFSTLRLPSANLATAPKFSMRVASKQAMNEGPIVDLCQFVQNIILCRDSSKVKIRGAPNRRFRAYEPTVIKNANEMDVRKAIKAQIKRDEATRQALPFTIVAGIALLGGIYIYLSNTF